MHQVYPNHSASNRTAVDDAPEGSAGEKGYGRDGEQGWGLLGV